jgi:hypothetical protein
MYNYNKSIICFDKLTKSDEAKKKFVFPQHIHKLLNKLKNFDPKENVQHYLRLLATYVRQDLDLKKIFDFFNWNEEKKVFEREIKQEELIKRLESTYELKLDGIMFDKKAEVEDVSNLEIGKDSANNGNLTLNTGNSNIHPGVYNSLNEDLSFSQNINGNEI